MAFFINEFYNNPAGKGATFLNIKAIQEKFNAKYDMLKNKIICSSCITKDDEVYIHIRLPSSVQGIYYDIVLGFTPTSKSAGNSIEDMEMQIFSNSPSFLYTFAYAYEKQGLLLKEFKKKLSPKMLTDVAKAKNPYGVLSYDFSVYASLKYVIEHNYVTLSSIKDIIECKSFRDLYKNVTNADALQKERKQQKDFNKLLEQQEEHERKNAIKNLKYSSKKNIDEPKETKDVAKAKYTKIGSHAKTVKKTKKI